MKVRSLMRPVWALALLAVLGSPVVAQDVSGHWVVTVQAPDYGEIQFDFMLEQDGTAVTGEAVGSSMAEIESMELSDGLSEDGVFSMLLHIGAQGQFLTAEVEGDVDGDEIVGEIYIAEMGSSAPFTAARKKG